MNCIQIQCIYRNPQKRNKRLPKGDHIIPKPNKKKKRTKRKRKPNSHKVVDNQIVNITELELNLEFII